MSRGFLSGVAAGAVVSVVGLAGLSVVTHPDLEGLQQAMDAPPVSETPLDTASGEGTVQADAGAGADDAPQEPSSSAEMGEDEGVDPDAGSTLNTPVQPSSDTAAENTVESGPAPTAPETPLLETANTAPEQNAEGRDTLQVNGTQTNGPQTNALQTDAPEAPAPAALNTDPVAVPTGPAARAQDKAPEGGGTELPIGASPDTPATTASRPTLPQITPPPANGAALPGGDAPQADPPAARRITPPSITPPSEESGDAKMAEPAPVPRIKSDPVAPIGDLAKNVTTDRLPSIPAPTADKGATDVAVAAPAVASPPPSPLAIKRNAAEFTPVPDRPLMAVLLKDEGGARGDLGDLSALPFAISFVVEANAPDAADAIAFYRAAGAEVVVAADLPANATPADAEVNFQVQAERMQDASAVMMMGGSGFQEDSALASQVSEILMESGHGLISEPKGLSTGHRLAIKAGVPAGLIFRDVDGAGQNGRAIRRFMDNAAFKARQQDGVIVYGRARPETLQALIEWSLGNRAKSVSVAPVSAVLLGE